MLPLVSSNVLRVAAVLGLTAVPAVIARTNRTAPCDPNNAGITLPSGFCATLFADSLGAARHIAVASNGDVIVNARPVRNQNQPEAGNPGGVFILRDADRDGKAEIKRRAADAAGTGIAIANGYVYATAGNSVLRYPYRAGALQLGGRADRCNTAAA